MFIHPISTTSASSLSTWTYSNPVDLNNKWNDRKNITLKLDIASELSESSAAVDVNYVVSDLSGGTYTSVITGSGTSLILTSGTSEGGALGNGSYLIPLTILPVSGTTVLLTAGMAPYIKIGTRSSDATPALSMKLLVG
jgi:hypothetical protein